MRKLTGYRLIKLVSDSLRSTIYCGSREKDEEAIVAKFHAGASPSNLVLQRVRSEFQLGQMVDHPNVISYLALEEDQKSLVIVMKDVEGVTLSEYLSGRPAPTLDFLDIALQAAAGLKAIHQCGIMHKDINPQNMVINPKTKQVYLIDFGLASLLDQEKPDAAIPSQLRGTLAYISPEQTGRMNQGLDFRTDFYSLGAAFYQLLTGHPPFVIKEDPLALIHAHIARLPPAPAVCNEAVPQQLSNLVMKLLEKEPDKRYQSAAALVLDLEKCRARFIQEGEIEPFGLGENDGADRFSPPMKLYGRDEEKEQLMRAFSKVVAGPSEFLVIAGPPGVGKSTLVHEVQKPLVAHKGLFCSGKFEQYLHNAPYSAVGQALGELCRYALAMPGAQLSYVKEQIQNAMKGAGHLLTPVIPELSMLLDKETHQPTLDPNSAKSRMLMALTDFIGIFARKGSPLVLFLDDLQWADSESLALLDVLCESRYCLMIGAYRDNEVLDGHILSKTLERLSKHNISRCTLKPLGREALEQWLSDALRADPVELSLLADLLMVKTGGNPFFFYEFLKRLHSDRLLTFDEKRNCWTWDLAAVKEEKITDNVVSLMQEKIGKQPEATRRFLMLAACLGTTFHMETLSMISQEKDSKLTASLWPAMREGLLYSREKGDGQVFQFPHDRVQQAAYALIDEDRREATHLRIGRLLRNHNTRDQPFQAVEHLNLGRSGITDREERLGLVALNLQAGKSALQSTAFDNAADYLQIGIELLPPKPWSQEPKLTRDLYQGLAQCELLRGHWDQSETWYQLLLSHSRSPLEKAAIHKTRMSVFELNVMEEPFFKAAAQALLVCNLQLPASSRELADAIADESKSMAHFQTGRKLTDVIPREPMEDGLIYQTIGILSQLTLGCLKMGDGAYIEWAALKGLNLIRQYGFHPDIINLISRLSIHYQHKGKQEAAFQFADYTMAFGEMMDDQKQVLSEMGDLYIQVESFRQPMRHVQSVLDLIAGHLRDRGEYFRACYVMANKNYFNFFLSIHVKEYMRCCRQSQELTQKLRLPVLERYIHIFWEAGAALLGESEEDESLAATSNFWDQIPETYVNIHFHNYFKQELSFWLEGAENARSIPREDDFCNGMHHTNTWDYLNLMIKLASHHQTEEKLEDNLIAQLDHTLQKYAGLARTCEDNYAGQWRLLEAEKARVANRPIQEVTGLYKASARASNKAGHLQYEALAQERLACYWRDQNMLDYAGLHLREAHYLYRRWGARAVAAALPTRYPHIPLQEVVFHHGEKAWGDATQTQTHDPTGTASTEDNGGSSLDVQALMKSVRAISSEMEFQKLLTRMMEVIMESAGARRAALIMDQDEGLQIQATIAVDREPTLTAKPLKETRTLPKLLIRYVFRSGAPILLPHEDQPSALFQDPYLEAHPNNAHLCMPLRQKDRVSGVLYLENDLSPNAFTSKRLTVLKVLLAQAAVSMENARLFSEVQRFNLELEDMVSERTRQLKDTQKELLEKAHLAGMADVAISVLHNLGNLLNSVTVSSQMIDTTIRRSRFGNMPRANALLEELMGEWGQSDHPKGGKLLDYYKVLQDLTAEDNKVIQRQVEVILEKVDGIQKVIQSQEAHTTGGSFEENLPVLETLQEAVDVLQGMLEKNEVRISVEADPELRIQGRRSKVVYVATNLIRNAVESMTETPTEQRRMVITTSATPTDILLHFSDYGCGVEKENLQKIFSHGFTTKEGHKGFGLHNCANAVTEMGGSIWADSRGLGMGSILAVRLPRGEAE